MLKFLKEGMWWEERVGGDVLGKRKKPNGRKNGMVWVIYLEGGNQYTSS